MQTADTPRSRRTARRIARADATRRRALSPTRILLRLAGIPILIVVVTVSIYIRTSAYPPGDALRHLVAMFGCEAAAGVNLAPATQGGLGYHLRNDPDGDGVACGTAMAGRAAAPRPKLPDAAPPPERSAAGAKFVRP